MSINFTEFIMQDATVNVEANTGLPAVLHDIANACKAIAIAITKGALTGTMGEAESQNVQGERQKQLDVIANDIFIELCQSSGYVAGMVSEEMGLPYEIPMAKRSNGRYLLVFDPLDGSSNVNVNISVGSIFSILRCPSEANNPTAQDFLQQGTQQVCAGYAIYGSSTMLVLTSGNGVNGFTLDEETDEFVWTHPAMRIPADTSEFAINMSNQRFWEPSIQRYIAECMQGIDGPRGKDFNMRWVASMVAEVHRILTRGGIFLYPIDSKIKAQGGKLRLLYEANPMAYIVEQAGGSAVANGKRLLEIVPEHVHQRVPVILGSSNEVEQVSRPKPYQA